MDSFNLESIEHAVERVVDEVKEDVVSLWVRVKSHVGTVFHDPVSDVVVTHAPVEVLNSEWARAQIAAGLIEEVPAPTGE